MYLARGQPHRGSCLGEELVGCGDRRMANPSHFGGAHGVDLESDLVRVGKERLVPQRRVEGLTQDDEPIRWNTGGRDVRLSERRGQRDEPEYFALLFQLRKFDQQRNIGEELVSLRAHWRKKVDI